ncbi:MAG: SpoIIE family protein phosphatase [Planctomycetes bacterium]|nr:SpoIIE family protein phosphatase [Planctomycetota bacterium]
MTMFSDPGVHLIVRKGQREGKAIPIPADAEVTLGRDVSCTVQVADGAMSRQHFSIRPTEDDYLLADLGSSNGTWVNGERVRRRVLAHGDRISAGDSVFEFVDPRGTGAGAGAGVEPGRVGVALVEDGEALKNATFVGALDFSMDAVNAAARESGIHDGGRKSQDALSTIYDVANLINTETNINRLFGVIAEAILKVVPGDRVFLILHNPRNGAFNTVAARSRVGGADVAGGGDGATISKTITTEVVTRGVSVISRDTSSDQKYSALQSIVSFSIKSVMCAPLKAGARLLGAVYVDSIGVAREFTKFDLSLLSAVGGLAGVALERAQLTQHFLEKEKMKKTLEIARNIQRSLLPKSPPPVAGLDLAGASEACDETGGDYYDFLSLPGGRLGLVVGDVSGHGVGAALLMATARAFLKALGATVSHIGRALAVVNTLLEEDTEDDTFMTLFLGAYDPAGRTLSYASAGHDEPILYRAAGGGCEPLPSTGPPLGMMPGQEFEVRENIALHAGDVLCLCTDGVWEAPNERDEPFGRERLEALIRANAALPAREIVAAVLTAVRAHRGARPQTDDLTLIVARAIDAPASPSGPPPAPEFDPTRPRPTDPLLPALP